MPKSSRFARAVAASAAIATVLAGCGTAGESPAAQPPSDQPPSDQGSRAATSYPGPRTDPPMLEPVTSAPPDEQPPDVPEQLDFTAETVDGSTFDGSSIAGRDAIVYFWAPWCPICRSEAPGLADVVAGYSDLTFVTVGGSSQDREAMADFVRDVGFDDFPNVADESGEIWTRFGVTYQYTYAFVDDAGTVELVTGPLDEADLRARIDALLAS